jgi:hypothetical protein
LKPVKLGPYDSSQGANVAKLVRRCCGLLGLLPPSLGATPSLDQESCSL